MAQSAYDKAVSLLAMREHTKNELKDKLEKKGYREDDVIEAVSRLEREGYIRRVTGSSSTSLSILP